MTVARVLFMSGLGDLPHGPHPASVAVPWQRTGSTGRWILWRLLSSNNRELGRSAVPRDEHALSVADLARLKASLDRSEAVIAHGASGPAWYWTLHLDGAAAARSGRGYERLRECQIGLEQFLRSLPDAEVHDDPERLVLRRRPHPVPGEFEPIPTTEVR